MRLIDLKHGGGMKVTKIKEVVSHCNICGAPIFIIYEKKEDSLEWDFRQYPLETEIEFSCSCRFNGHFTIYPTYPDNTTWYFPDYKWTITVS